jgi:hypothetical protein
VIVGYYNTYTAAESADFPGRPGLQIAADPQTGEVHALRGTGFASVQFHLESLLSTDGFRILADLTAALLGPLCEPPAAVTARMSGGGTITEGSVVDSCAEPNRTASSDACVPGFGRGGPGLDCG